MPLLKNLLQCALINAHKIIDLTLKSPAVKGCKSFIFKSQVRIET